MRMRGGASRPPGPAFSIVRRSACGEDSPPVGRPAVPDGGSQGPSRRLGWLRVDEPTAVPDRAQLVLWAARLADRPAVVDQEDMRLVRPLRSAGEHRE